ncbi:MAG: hypothetical protein ACI8XZ_005108 [Gammaproteobacteria bacterium]|jgi:hypothetical protein
MYTRRGFLVSSAAVMAGPTLLHAGPSGSRTRVVIDSSSPEGDLFSQYFRVPTTAIDLDPLSVLTELSGEFANHELDTIYGLTRGSNRFLIEQFAKPNGYRIIHAGEHEFGDGQIAHKLTGAPRSMDDLVEDIARASANWPVEVARLLESKKLDHEAPTNNDRVVGADVPAGRVGQLCSWTLQRV